MMYYFERVKFLMDETVALSFKYIGDTIPACKISSSYNNQIAVAFNGEMANI